MAGMELPLLQAPTPDTQAPAVVRPQSEAFQHIAEAGGNLQHDIGNLWYMNRMARMNEQDAAMAHSTDSMEAASWKLRTDAETQNIEAEQQPAFYRQGLMAAAEQDLARYPEGPLKDRVSAMWAGQADKGGREMAYHATVSHLQQADAQVKSQLADSAKTIPFMPPDAQARMQATGHALIDKYVQDRHLPPEAADDMHARYMANIALGTLQKNISDNPGKALSEMTASDFDSKHTWLGLVGGETKKDQLITQAVTSIKNADIQTNVRVIQARQEQMDTLFKMHDAGQPISNEMLDRATLVPANVRELLKPTWRPQPPGDPEATKEYMDRADSITSPADLSTYKLGSLMNPNLSPRERQQISDAGDAALKRNQSAVGQAYRGALEDLKNRYDPPQKGPYQITPAEEAHRKDLANRAAQMMKDYVAANPGVTADQVGAAKQAYEKQLDQYDKRYRDKREKVEKIPTPDGLKVSAATMDDEALRKKIESMEGAH